MTDLRDAVRSLRSTPVVAAAAILSLALGIGANTAIFSILDALTLRPLPVREPSRLVQLMLGPERSSWTYPLFEQLTTYPDLFEGACAWSSPRFDLARGGQSDFVNGLWVSGNFFEVMGVPALLGRTITRADDVRGGGAGGPVAVVSYGFWQRRLGGAADAIGRPITLERVTFTIVGVTPPDFTGPDTGRAFDVAVPIGAELLIRRGDSALNQRSYWWLGVVARLKPGQSVERALSAYRAVRLPMREATLPPNWRPQDLPHYLEGPFALKPAATGLSGLRRRYQQPLVMIMAVVLVVLFVACANVANLMLARATARRHEMSVRRALGASGWRLARQLLAETLLVSVCGAAAGLFVARVGSALLVSQLSTDANPVFLRLGLDWRVLVFTTTIAALSAILFGTAPALRASRAQPNDALKQSGRTVAGEARWGASNLIVVAQVGLSLVLVVAAGLFVRTFAALERVDLGFQEESLLVVDVNARPTTASPEARGALYERAREAVRVVPGVEQVALSTVTPVSGMTWDTLIENPDGLSLSEDERDVYLNRVGPDWFTTYGTVLVAGRDFARQDRLGSPEVVIINETAARRFFPGTNPIGRTIRESGRPGEPEPALQIVGIVRDAVYSSLRADIPPTMYRPLAQMATAPAAINLSVRSAGGSPALLTRAVTDAIGRVDRDLALTFHPLARDLRASLGQERLVAMLSGFFGALALLLAGVGLYGVVAYTVSRRKAEIAIRMALGAAPGAVLGLILRRVALIVSAGIVCGLATALWSARYAAPLLFHLEPWDPLTLASAVAALATVGAIAGWIPARRAARLDPASALRDGT